MTAGSTAARRALHVLATFGAGGPQIRMTQVVARMGPGWRHAVLAMNGDMAARAQLPTGVDCEVLPPPPKRGFVRSVRAFVRLLQEHRADLLLTYNWGAIECVAAARLLGLGAHVHHEDGFGPEELQRPLRRRDWLRRLVLGRAHAIVVPSHRLLTIATQRWHLGSRAVHLPNGVDCGRFRPDASAGASASGVFTIGTVGGLRGEKDHAMLLAAFARLSLPARLLLVGDGPERARLQRLAEELGIAARVEFAGAVTDTAPCYRRMDVFVLSSRTEQMPISLLEAMASGLPVCATDVGDVARMLPGTARGGLVGIGDPAALAAVLDALGHDITRRRREGEANRAHCQAHYELGACLARYTGLYERAASAAARIRSD